MKPRYPADLTENNILKIHSSHTERNRSRRIAVRLLADSSRALLGPGGCRSGQPSANNSNHPTLWRSRQQRSDDGAITPTMA
jgi:hypothetical protein